MATSWDNDTRAYVGTDGNLAVLDVTDSSTPDLLDLLELEVDWSDGNHGVQIVGNTAFAAANKSARLVVAPSAEQHTLAGGAGPSALTRSPRAGSVLE